MGRGSNRAKGHAKRAAPRKAQKPADAQVRDLEKRLAAAVGQLQTRDRELAEAQEQLTATSEILHVISSSPADYQPVFDTIVRRAGVVCGAVDAILWTVDGSELVVRAHHGPIPATIGARQPMQGSVAGVAAREARVIHVEDLTQADDFPVGREIARRVGWRTTLSAPLLRGDVAIGALLIRRSEVRPFTDRQIELLQTFADEAVIALENVRLFNETRESLEQQTATSEILRVISTSPTDTQSVFDSIIRNAVRLLGGFSGVVTRRTDEQLDLAALTSTNPSGDAAQKALWPKPIAADRSVHGQVITTLKPVVITDVESDPSVPPEEVVVASARGYRSIIAVPLVREARAVGSMAVTRRAPGPFSDSEIALLRTFADQAVIAIENVRMFTELQASNKHLTDALDKQTATSDILRAISRSQTDVRPVFEEILSSAIRLMGAQAGVLTRLTGDHLDLAAFKSTDTRGDATLRAAFPLSLQGHGAHADAIRTRMPVSIGEAQNETREPARSIARAVGYQSLVVVPMLHHEAALGTISAVRPEPGGFSEEEIALLQTFADQAVIAIENVRLFTELQQKNHALTEAHGRVTEALEQQTATSEILRTIAHVQTDAQPVFETIVQSAARLCHGAVTGLFLTDGQQVYLPANCGGSAEALAVNRARFPRPLDMETPPGVAMLTRSVVHVADTEDPSAMEYARQTGRLLGFRSAVTVPMLREGDAVGAIAVTRPDPGRFSDAEVGLLKTFADQAVIAIENVRLFTELQASNRELTTALDKQTATSDILRVISRSQTDVQPVFEAILSSAVRLLGAYTGALTRVVDNQIVLAAFSQTDDAGAATVRAAFPQSLQSDLPHAQTIRDRAPLNIADAQTDPRLPEADQVRARVRGYRSRVLVPLLRGDEAIGAISLSRREPGGFNADEIALLQTFADQAVIAIENARLLTALQARTDDLTRSVEQLTALGDVGRAVSSTLDLETVLTTIVSRAVELSGLDGGVMFEYDGGAEEFVHRVATEVGGALAEARRTTRVRKGEGVVGQTALTLEPAQVVDITVPGAYESRLRESLIASGIRAVLAVPMVREGELIGCLVVSRNRPGEFTADTIELLRTFATQSALAIQNARLFREIELKSRELEAASQHKSEFLANMSHELRTPLNAIIGFSEVLSERLFGDLNEKQAEYLKDIHTSGQHLLSLINDILDLSKIEAGRMELELSGFDLPTTIDNALILVRERAARRGIALHRTVDGRLGQIQADERKVRQVLLNLLSNAIKFTPEGGRIEVGAQAVNGSIEVSVTDTGVGIAPEDQEAVFEEFRQVGSAEKKVEGTGLGLALSRKFIELHGGRIWVKSQVGQGSTFTFTIPVRGE